MGTCAVTLVTAWLWEGMDMRSNHSVPRPQSVNHFECTCKQRRNARVNRVTFNERLNILVLGS